MTFALAAMIAVSFWGARNVPVTCPLRPVVTQEANMPTAVDGSFAVAAAYGPDTPRCGVILLSEYAQGLRTEDPAQYCAVIVHEVGHVGGLQHTATGIMAPGIGPADYPWQCRITIRQERERVRNHRNGDKNEAHHHHG